MSNLLKCTEINSSFPFAGRAARREMIRGLNFTIANLMTGVVRQRALAAMAPQTVNPGQADIENPYPKVDLQPLVDKFGLDKVNTLDERNEQDANTHGTEVAGDLREEQGLQPVKADPRILAGKLKVIRDALAIDLEKYAHPIPNPLGRPGETYLNPYEIGEPLLVTLEKQIRRPVQVNRDLIRAQAEALGLDPIDVERIQLRQQEASLRFLKENRAEIVRMVESLQAFKPAEGKDGDANRVVHEIDDRYEPTLASVEDLELDIPAIHRARLYVNAERGFFYERDRWISAMIRRHPEAATHLKILDGCREAIHKAFDMLMQNPRIAAEISAEVLQGATYPTMFDLPKPQTEATQAA